MKPVLKNPTIIFWILGMVCTLLSLGILIKNHVPFSRFIWYAIGGCVLGVGLMVADVIWHRVKPSANKKLLAPLSIYPVILLVISFLIAYSCCEYKSLLVLMGGISMLMLTVELAVVQILWKKQLKWQDL
jgi:hypothetical protein